MIRNECRQGGLQFLDQGSVPMTITTPGSTNGMFFNHNLGSPSDLVFYNPASGDCSMGIAQNSITFFPPTSTVISSKFYYYKIVAAATSPPFSFSLQDSGGGVDMITGASAELTFGSNFFQAVDSNNN